VVVSLGFLSCGSMLATRGGAKDGWERTFAWICHNQRMAKDYERLRATGEAFVYAAMTRLMVRRLARA
jgi:hypothetical protein